MCVIVFMDNNLVKHTELWSFQPYCVAVCVCVCMCVCVCVSVTDLCVGGGCGLCVEVLLCSCVCMLVTELCATVHTLYAPKQQLWVVGVVYVSCWCCAVVCVAMYM